jgi:RNase adapter protein RapZ
VDGNFELVVVTGMSGAGRSTAANALEDLGFMVIDNLPPQVLKSTVELLQKNQEVSKLAVVVDVRGGSLFNDLSQSVQDASELVSKLKVIFLEASDVALVRRFESSRRPHPLQHGDGLLTAILAERELLSTIRDQSDLIIDTTDRNVHELRRVVESNFDEFEAKLRLTIVSFGFKYGLPMDADLVADMRFLPNPYWQPELKNLTGIDAPVNDFVMSHLDAQNFLTSYVEMLQLVIPGYLREGKKFATVAIGCTGGQHRSVAIAENLAARLAIDGLEVQVMHRDRGRE